MHASPTLWLLFSLKGRISRRVYWQGVIGVLCLNTALYFQALRIVHDYQVLQLMEQEVDGWRPLVMMVAAIATLSIHIAVSVKRLHDFGYSGFLAIAVAIPLLNIIFAIWAGLVPGSGGPNAYGATTDEPVR